MNEPTMATVDCATAVWIGLLVAAFTPAPPIAPEQHWQPTSSQSSYPGRLVPQRYRRCLRVLILDLAFTPEATLNRPPPFPSHLGDGNAKRWRLRGSTLRMRRSRAWLESRGLSCSPPSRAKCDRSSPNLAATCSCSPATIRWSARVPSG